MAVNHFKDFENLLPKESFYRNSQIVREYGQSYEYFILNSLLVKDPNLFAKYKNSNLITISTQTGTKSISKDLLIDLISIEGLYRYLITNMDNDFSIAARIDYFENGEIKDSIFINRADLSAFLLQLDTKTLNYQQRMRIALFTNITTLFSLERKFQDKQHSAIIDGEIVSVAVPELISILTMTADKFNQFVAGTLKLSQSKEVMVYLLNDFVKRNRIIEKYHLPVNILERYNELESQTLIDYESINKNLKSNDTDLAGNSLIDKVVIDEELYEEIFKFCKKTYSNLEKAMYIYVRLCELLTYDQGYYASPATEENKTVEQIRGITLRNNAITNYEFLIIYTALLKSIGIRYTLDNRLIGGESDLASITFREGEYLVKVDTLKDVVVSDLTNAKINAPLTGLTCLNHNAVSKQKFEELFYKVINELIDTKKERILFEGSLKEYHRKFATTDLPFKDKFYILLKDIARPNLKGMDAIGYQKKVFDNLFSNDDRISINFISSMINNHADYTYTPLTIITLQDNGRTIYYLIDPNRNNIVETISESELEEYFMSGDFAYINETDSIPELELVEGVKYVR